MQIPPDQSEEQPNEPSTEDLVNKVYGPSQTDIDRSWDGYESDGSSRKLGGMVWKATIVIVSVVILASLSIGILGPLFGGGNNTSQPAPPERISAEVLRVIDGRTIVVDAGDGEMTVRLIGIETKPFGDPFHDYAQQVTESWIDGKAVILETDQRDGDDQGRFMRYVFLETVMINAALILNGLGTSDTEHPNVRYDGYLTDMERQARDSGAGIWDERFQVDTPDSEVWLRSHGRQNTISS
jgi:endonuclease YncB( thermonuclease family)